MKSSCGSISTEREREREREGEAKRVFEISVARFHL